MNIEQELKALKEKRLKTLKDEIVYSVKVFNNARKNNVEYLTKENFKRVMQEHKKLYKILTA